MPGCRATEPVRGNVPQTQDERKAETRARLLAAAAELFAEQGIDAVSVDAVAEAAGRTSGAVYAHFGSKQGLLLALLDSWRDSVLTVLLAEVAVTESPLGQLAAVWGNLGGALEDGQGGWSLLEQELWLRAARDDEVAAVVRSRNAEARGYTARRLSGWSSAVDAVAEAAGRTSGAVYAHFGSKQGLLLALLDSWKDSVLTVLLAEVAVTDSPTGQLGAVWANVSDDSGRDSSPWPLLEHELWLRAARDPEVADVVRVRNAEALRYSARRLDGWTAAVGATPDSDPEELAVLVKALLTGLAMQKRLDPDAVSDDLALRGLSALVGLPTTASATAPARPPGPARRSTRPDQPSSTEETTHAH